MVNRKTIWNFAQNKPSLIVKDITEQYPDVNEDFVYEVLLRRGVFKWLSVRRNIIKLKDEMRDEVSRLNRKKNIREKGYYEALLKYRAKIRALCHSDRWVAPDFDRRANEFLGRMEDC